MILFTTLILGGHQFSNSNRDYIATEPALPPTRTRHRNASRSQKPLPYNAVSATKRCFTKLGADKSLCRKKIHKRNV